MTVRGCDHMETLFSQEMMEWCIASAEEEAEAKKHGKRFALASVDGKIVAYIWRGKIYVTEVAVTPEAGR